MAQEVFRKVALDRLASPEQLDQLMQVTTARGWLALAAAAVLVVLGLGWSMASTIPERVSGQGILIRSGGVLQVEAPSSGRIADVAAQVGDVITEGQVVARIAQEDLANQVEQARARVTQLEARRREIRSYSVRDDALEDTYSAQRAASLEQSIQAAGHMLTALAERMRNEQQLVQQGLITRQTLLATTSQYDALKETQRGDEVELAQLRIKQLQAGNDRQEKVQESDFELAQARRDQARLEAQLHDASEVVSPYTGRVLEVMTEQGSMTDRGKPLLSIDLEGKAVKNLEAVIYIPSVHGKKIKPGMEIQISPSTVRREEYGYLLGKVTYVSDYPATPQGMERVLKNEQLVAALSGHDAPFEVRADLIPDPSSPSGYRWSSGKGPGMTLQSGSLASAAIVVERRRPISLVIPGLGPQAGR